uniref:Translation initiation factor IF-2, chloroplastic n=1 Tax=Ophidocladus simpliciusculus TaxID=1261574 RepID=A0A1Z1MIV9_9FLOR|nr:translation initiation factor 2 [Ophidocladus simpliciusculus]ARW65998.1 translation initiation factor 2 [Ophidocladus simpliciusculus]
MNFFKYFDEILCIYHLPFSLLCFDNTLSLTLPKLISAIDLSSIKSMNSMKSNNDFNNTENISNKLGNKYKLGLYEKNIIDTPKNKNRIIKKKRKISSDTKKDEIFIDSRTELLAERSLPSSLLKSHKLNNKNRKKDKVKLDLVQSKDDLVMKLSSYKEKNSLILNQSNKSVLIDSPVTIYELSCKLNIPEAEIITYLFLNKGISATINQVLDVLIAQEVALHYDFVLIKMEVKPSIGLNVNKKNITLPIGIKRLPIIAILGHVDHGKTTLLDSILKTNLVQAEYGGITQAISGHELHWQYDSEVYKLILLDTPGHESFKTMRLRSAKVADIVLLIIAADDGLQPQTIESIHYIKQMNLQCIVVITKIDKIINNANKIKQDLGNMGLLVEELGGSIISIQVSAITHENIPTLLSTICMLSKKSSLFADPEQSARGTILEAYLDKRQGPLANVIVQSGTLKLGDIIVSSNTSGKVKRITNLSNIEIRSSEPSSFVQILGFSSVPQAGSFFQVVTNEKEAKNYCLQQSIDQVYSGKLLDTRISTYNNANIKKFNLIVKANTQGSLEAIIQLLSQIPQAKVQINLLSSNLGNLSNRDIDLAISTNSLIIAFNLNISSQIRILLKKNKIIFEHFNNIYELFDYVQDYMLDLIEPEYEKIPIGNAIVQTVFNMNQGSVAGCFVSKGKLKKACYIHVNRKGILVYQGHLKSLKQMKNSVDEVFAMNECGLMSDYNQWQQNDVIDAYELVLKDKVL